MAPGTLSTDAVTLGQLDRNHFAHAYLDTDVTDLGASVGAVYVPYRVNFD